MLGRSQRLTGSDNFKKVQNQGKIFQSQSFGLAYLDRNDKNPSRFAFVVSTKIAKEAVDRNRFKRLMSESIRTGKSDIKDGYDIVFLAKTTIVRCPSDELMKEVRMALKEAGLMK